ncbi:uncharacterized protein JCM6883_002720 [Sporobolomyces salmoneus]|uniref:uncharacterized protein n=1 Tax=Sporobolomyces salmoneus TaxID=183962 RepID=UPI00317DEB98
MSYDPYSAGGPGGGYVPPPPNQGYGGPPPPPQFQPNLHSRRESNDYSNRYSGGGGDYNSGPAPPRGRPHFSPPPSESDQGWNSRSNNSSYGRRRSLSPVNRYGGGGGGDDYGGGGGGYRRERGTRGGRGRNRDDRGGDSYGRRRDDDGGPSGRGKDERPGRILFVRNLKFGVTPEEVREKFAEIGDIKTFFDLVEKRSMAFITYYDARAAMMAKDRLHQALLQGRPMDVHFSLPRDADMAQDCDREKGQGTLSLVILPFPGARINQALPPPTDSEIYARFSPYGDLKQVFPSYKRPDMRYIEFFDSRGTCLAYDKVHGSRMAGGIADLRFVWDKYPMEQSKPPPAARRNDRFNDGPYGSEDRYGGPPPGSGYNPPPPPPHASGYGAPPPLNAYGASNYSPAGLPPPAPYGMAAPPPPQNVYGYDSRPPLPPSASSGYDQNPYHQPQQGMPPPSGPPVPPAPEPEHGLEQAKKMQDLLASLMANPTALSSMLPPAQQPQAQTPIPPSTQSPLYPPPPQVQQSPSLQAPVIKQEGGGGNSTPLPAAVSSLLAQAGVPQQQSPVAPTLTFSTNQSPSRANTAGGTTPQPNQEQASTPAPAANNGGAQVQALLALLAQQKAQSS